MISPYCDKKMEWGYPVFQNTLMWSKKGKSLQQCQQGKIR